MAFDVLELPNGKAVGTGLKVPTMLTTAFPAYGAAGPMLTSTQIEAAARSGAALGRTRFDKSYTKDQHQHGSCQGFASAAATTRARVRRGQARVDLSGAYAYSLVNGGRDNGSLLEDGMLACQGGYATEATVPWQAIYPRLYDVGKAKAEAARFKAFEVYAVRSRDELFSALVSGFDCVVAVHADANFMHLDGEGQALGGDGPGNHAVLVDGLGWSDKFKTPLPDMNNSWGLNYGQDGRAFVSWDRHLTNTTRYHVFYAIRAAADDPQGDNPPEPHN